MVWQYISTCWVKKLGNLIAKELLATFSNVHVNFSCTFQKAPMQWKYLSCFYKGKTFSKRNSPSIEL